MKITKGKLRQIILEEIQNLVEQEQQPDEASAEAQRAAAKLPAPRINPLTEVPPPRDTDEFPDSMSRVTEHPAVIMALKPGTRIAVQTQGSPSSINVDDFAFGRVVGIAKAGGILGMGAQNWFVVEIEGERIPYSEESLQRGFDGPMIYAHQDDFVWPGKAK